MYLSNHSPAFAEGVAVIWILLRLLRRVLIIFPLLRHLPVYLISIARNAYTRAVRAMSVELIACIRLMAQSFLSQLEYLVYSRFQRGHLVTCFGVLYFFLFILQTPM